MAEQERKQKRETGGSPPEATAPNPETVKKGKKLKEDLDKLMDEVDEVLEENAEEFVKSYVQRGGE
ncbi:MAG: ubiquitin-like protein Pup [Candidatus Methylomirabilota bacterium]|nr:ubiquitin-like protein Pup [Candidatus Methylomirabilis sp.]NJD68031.1 ubiquitin-like protein Pup [candidate division NC10 bacterium]PWB48801.1 MAG: ubiquitin-like protein Pup [candidate division NC10 bacterium]